MVAAGALISGTGTNLQAIIDRIAARQLDCALRVVVSNRAGAPGLARAEAAGIPTRVIDHKSFARREDFDRAAFPLRIMNIHPALLPSFKSLDAQRQALAYGVKVAGATVHFVDEDTDHGPIIVQGAVAIGPEDGEDEVRRRILAVEHEIYPLAIQLFAEGRLTVEGRRVIVRGPRPPLPPPLVHW